jgi:chromate reductase, NAD(P)H dehydrogenase (quinone)
LADTIRILGLSGSLRNGSANSGLLRAAGELLPDDVTLETFDLSAIPLYNADHDGEAAPQAVRSLKASIAAADALLIATPEYNYSIPGVLKNAIDWASRPPKDSPLDGKPLAIMGAGGVMGTVRAQMALRQVAVFTNMHVLNRPEVLISRAWEKFDANGNLIDETSRQAVRALLESLSKWTRLLLRRVEGQAPL